MKRTSDGRFTGSSWFSQFALGLLVCWCAISLAGCRGQGWPCSSAGYNNAQPYQPYAAPFARPPQQFGPNPNRPPASVAPTLPPRSQTPFREVAPPTIGPLTNSPPAVPPNLTAPNFNGPSINGPGFNGPSFNGPRFNGPNLGTPNGPPLSGPGFGSNLPNNQLPSAPFPNLQGPPGGGPNFPNSLQSLPPSGGGFSTGFGIPY